MWITFAPVVGHVTPRMRNKRPSWW